MIWNSHLIMTKKIQDLAKNKQDNTFKEEKNNIQTKNNSIKKLPDTPLFVKKKIPPFIQVLSQQPQTITMFQLRHNFLTHS